MSGSGRQGLTASGTQNQLSYYGLLKTKIINNMFKTNTMSKLWLTLAIMLVSAVNAVAGNVVSISGFEILPGEEKELSVMLDNTDAVCALQFEVSLPAGLSIKQDEAEDYFQKTTRSIRHQMKATKGTGENYQVLIYSAAMRELAGSEGAVATFTVKASSSYNPVAASTIKLQNVTGSNQSGTVIDQDDSKVLNEEARFILSADAVEMVEGTTTVVALKLYNKWPAVMMQARITLPEGMEIVKDAYGDYFAPTTRTEDHELAGKKIADNEYSLLINHADNKRFKDSEGAVATFILKADKVMENALIHVTNAVCADKAANSIAVEDLDIVVNVNPAQVIFFEDAKDIIKNAGDKYALVKLDDAANKAKIDAEVADLNAAVIGGEMTREEALAELEKVIKEMEQATGDVNLDGEFDVDDAQALFNAVLGTGNTEHLYDSNGDGDIDVDDAQYLFNKSLGL